MSEQPVRLSIVVTTRNDNHGGRMAERTGAFLRNLQRQCCRYGQTVELVIVEWNPPSEHPALAKELTALLHPSPLRVRVITVDASLHRRFQYSAMLPMYQMIAKNVGIARAKGEYILATNIDILFNDSLFERLTCGALEHGKVYRLPRFDVPAEIVDIADAHAMIEQCPKRVLRVHHRSDTYCIRENDNPDNEFSLLTSGDRVRHFFTNDPFAAKSSFITNSVQMGYKVFKHQLFRRSPGLLKLWRVLCPRWKRQPFANACGDFQLLARDKWHLLRGYPEYHMYSLHIDAVFEWQAATLLREEVFPQACRIYHIEHLNGLVHPQGIKEIPMLSWQKAQEICADLGGKPGSGKLCLINDERWGLQQEVLPEQTVVPGKS